MQLRLKMLEGSLIVNDEDQETIKFIQESLKKPRRLELIFRGSEY